MSFYHPISFYSNVFLSQYCVWKCQVCNGPYIDFPIEIQIFFKMNVSTDKVLLSFLANPGSTVV